jgi:hypothetical protein
VVSDSARTDKIFRSAIDSVGLVQDTSLAAADSAALAVDSISFKFADSEIKNPIHYTADDSMVYDLQARKMYLYNKAEVKYENISLQADSVEFDWNTYILAAGGRTNDSTGEISGKPVFTDSGKEYRAGRMAYNFKTKRGKVFDVITQEGEAYIHSQAVKRNELDEWFSWKAKYTTCNLEHPHFYFQSRKVKMIPNKVLVTGPANLVIGDAPTPLFIPFGIFPVKQGRRSGLIIPKPGRDIQFGFFLREGGYFWAVNDYFNLKLTADVFTNGSFGVSVGSQYKINYKASGAIGFSYFRTQPEDPDLPNQKANNAFEVVWNHTQDSKSIPGSNLSVNLNARSSNFYTASRITDSRLLQTQFNSGAAFSKNFGRNVSLSLNFNHAQNLLNKSVDVDFPVFRFNFSRFTPFRPKIAGSTPKWFENIGFQYSFEAKSLIRTLDSLFFTEKTFTKVLKYGINQTAAIDAPIALFKYFTFNPSFNYQERWFFQKENKRWDPDTVFIPNETTGKIDTFYGRVLRDTMHGFYGVRDFSVGASFNTKLTGIYNFKGKWIKGIRHVFTPSVRFDYRPDFGTAFWGYYYDLQTNAKGDIKRVSPFDIVNLVYSLPSFGRVGQISFQLNNNFDVKAYSKKDTVKNVQYLGVLERFDISGGYNFFADSLRLQPFLFRGNSRILNNLFANFSFEFDPYGTDTNNNRINTFYYSQTKRLLRFLKGNFALNATFQGKRKSDAPSPPSLPRGVSDYVSLNPDDYYDFNIPWSLNLAYNFDFRKGTVNNPDTIVTAQSIRVSGDFNLTPNWKFAINTGFDFLEKLPSLTNLSVIRNLHCWELSFNWTAFPVAVQQFVMELRVKSSVLQDLKLVRRRTFLQGGF